MKYTREFKYQRTFPPDSEVELNVFHAGHISGVGEVDGHTGLSWITSGGTPFLVQSPYATVKKWYEETREAWDNRNERSEG